MNTAWNRGFRMLPTFDSAPMLLCLQAAGRPAMPSCSSPCSALAVLPQPCSLCNWRQRLPPERPSFCTDLVNPQTLVIHYWHFSLMTSLFRVPHFLITRFLFIIIWSASEALQILTQLQATYFSELSASIHILSPLTPEVYAIRE